jgi:sugar O-acyltransferase (sialic acid O-acetyltransferase NeuD family)
MKKLAIIGASGHGKVIADIAVKNEYKEIVFLDDNPKVQECAGFRVVGTLEDIDKYPDYDVIVAIGNASIRKKIHKKVGEDRLTTLIHPQSVISRRVTIGKGTVVMAGAIVNSDTKIGEGCIINTGASVDHDCSIGDFVHVYDLNLIYGNRNSHAYIPKTVLSGFLRLHHRYHLTGSASSLWIMASAFSRPDKHTHDRNR